MPEQGLPKTWIIIRDGPIVKKHAVDGVAFAQLILEIQHALDTIGFSRYGKDYNKEDCHLFFSKIIPGSAVIPASPSTYITHLNEQGSSIFIFEEIARDLERLIYTLMECPEQFRSCLNEVVKSRPGQIGVMNNLLSLALFKSPIEIKTAVDQPKAGFFVPKSRIEYLNKLILDYGGIGNISIYGIIFEINGQNYYFKVKTENGKTVSCYFKPSMEDLVRKHYKKWVVVSGNMTQSKKTYKIDTVKMLEAYSSKELDTLGRYRLLKPINFQISYNTPDSLWCLENKDLALDGYGSTYDEAIQCLEECLEGHVLSFTLYPDDKHSADSLLIKEGLKQYINFEQVMQHLK